MNPEGGESPSDTQQTHDELISRSIKPEFYDPDLDEKDELWIQKRRKGQYSDAVLSCPACFTTLCLECQSPCFENVLYLMFVRSQCFDPFTGRMMVDLLSPKSMPQGSCFYVDDRRLEDSFGVGTGQCKAVNHGMATPCVIDSSTI
ncbi:hypothetical protein RJ639_013714 [Escallonia herrerae]|uniref:E2F-associated phosphoprotein n=1 Tax=Escallonia herrerae TaxID=1293975 RepID=A0AA88VID3_9ASTE|nr:hypothetical protein RJ639_013714 [Escallonia herrerae]